jgi:putative Holliday junction resolvase
MIFKISHDLGNHNNHKNQRSTMARIIAIDYGLKRTGLAVTDPLQIKDYFLKEQVERIIIGEPKNWDDTDTHATPLVEKCIKELQKIFPSMPLTRVDERYTSKMAKQAMIDMGMKKMQRRNKAIVDEIAATIMLQDYMRSIS